MKLVYADSSALAKLVRAEDFSPAVERALAGRRVATSEIASVELLRLARRTTAGSTATSRESSLLRAEAVYSSTEAVPLVDDILRLAASIPDKHLGTLDAVHVASALTLGPVSFLTYDNRQAEAALDAGLEVESPR